MRVGQIEEHKTSKAFGHAVICLNREEYAWLNSLAAAKCCGTDFEFVFHTEAGRQIEKANRLINLAWTDFGQKGSISFNQIRSSVATQANNQLSEGDRKKVAKAMCHNSATAERFYVALPDKEAFFASRDLRPRALKKDVQLESEEEEKAVETDSSSSEEEEEPVYADTPKSDSVSSSFEEARTLRLKSREQGQPPKRKLSFESESEPPIYTPSKCVVKESRILMSPLTQSF
ncbi:hypothetical protein WMY93_004035 [Mugilogobius chulae]|uniref:Uncharacterized protein n=1 Tax=Mugilogobius chulae TaxID=88201 RepID=A0AAW0PVX2_9GOBI